MTAELRPARLRPADIARLGSSGLRTRPVRAALAALGIAIGVAAMVAIIGISSSSSAEVRLQLNDLGPNLLQVTPGKDLQGDTVPLPPAAAAVIARIAPVNDTTQVGVLPLSVYRNDHIPSGETGSLSVAAATTTLLATLHATLAYGSWFDPVSYRFPAVVLGAAAAQHLGVKQTGSSVWIGNQWCVVIGVLNPVTLASTIDSTALVGWRAARDYLDFTGQPTTVYVRVDQSQLDAVDAIIPRSISPTAPQDVAVAKSSDVIAAQAAATSALSGLLIGLGGVALLIGGIGIANTMVVSVLERRAEIGLRRSLGATRGQIRLQFVAEALLLSLLGGSCGTVAGTLVTAVYAASRGWPASVPAWVSAAGLGITMVIGALAGLYPAVRASRLSPTVALTAL